MSEKNQSKAASTSSILNKRGRDVVESRYGLGVQVYRMTLDAIGKNMVLLVTSSSD